MSARETDDDANYLLTEIAMAYEAYKDVDNHKKKKRETVEELILNSVRDGILSKSAVASALNLSRTSIINMYHRAEVNEKRRDE